MIWTDHLWGKTNPNPEPDEPDFHHVLCHMLDVAVVAENILRDERAGHWVERLSAVLGAEPEPLARRLPFLIGIHDLGKASPGFQMKSEPHLQRLLDSGAPWPMDPAKGLRHDLELGRTLAETLPELGLFSPDHRRPEQFWKAVSLGVTAHHGTFFKPADLKEALAEVPRVPSPGWTWHAPWIEARRSLAERLRELLQCPSDPLPCRPGNLSAAVMLLNGLTILCDWIGSDTHVFRPSGLPADMKQYLSDARKAAAGAVAERRLLSFLKWKDEPSFASLFPDRTEIRSVQEALDCEALPEFPRQFLAVIEAPMGEGKTEAAALLACRLAWRGGCQGFYFALPTIATSNQMYGRIRRLLQSQGAEAVLLALVNGLAEFHPDIEEALRQQRDPAAYPEEQTVAFDAWYLPRKRSLVAAYGVGTIDQALLAALNTRHVGLRLLGLAGKVVIVDEVHAYDLYMSGILDRLLVWLRELGASVILLSATLQSKRRAELLRCFSPSRVPETDVNSGAEEVPYPLVTLVERDGPARPLPCGEAARRMDVTVERRPDGEEHRAETARWLLTELGEGGRAAWICNTVAEAQAVFRALWQAVSALPEAEQPELRLFHARCLQGDRRRIEAEVLGRFGPADPEASRQPERRVVLVATQVVEQSLDLDFDLMLSQLAPVDLLLQRLGRLWRHPERTARGGFPAPRLVLLVPETGPGGVRFGTSAYVYSPLILLRTLRALHGKEVLELPIEIRKLVEEVYSGENVPGEGEARAAGLDPEWFARAEQQFVSTQEKLRVEAEIRLLREPRKSGDFAHIPSEVTEETEHLAMQTRLGRPTVRVALLEAGDPLLDRARRLDRLPREAALEIARALLNRTVSLSYPPLVGWVLKEQSRGAASPIVLPALSTVNALRGVAVLELVGSRFAWRQDERDRWLRLDPVLGIVYDHEEETVEESYDATA